MGTPRTRICLSEGAKEFVRGQGAAATSDVHLQEVSGAMKIRI